MLLRMACCIIHFDDQDATSSTIRFTRITFERFIERRNQWLSLDGDQQRIARKSLDFFPHDEEELVTTDGAPELFFYKDCYRKFTDKTKVERAMHRISKSRTKIQPSATDQREEELQSLGNINRPLTRRSLSSPANSGEQSSTVVSRNKHVLPEVCIICRKKDFYFTDPVSLICFEIV